MGVQFPPIEPYDSGMLDVGDGHSIYWECCGNPDGRPAIYLHGGPGGGFSPGQRKFFDPARYKAVLFDQRGCGRSRPLASDNDADLSTNTTAHLIADIEALRRLHNVDRWVILGLSWGSTLGLAYAQAHPDRVRAAVLGLVMSNSFRDIEWFTRGIQRIFPREWERFAQAVPESLRHLRLVDAYATLLFDADPAVRERAAREWCNWEDAAVSLTPGHRPSSLFEDARFRLGFARLVTHYWRHKGFMEEDQLVRDAVRLNGIPGVMIQGRYDVSGPPETAWRISRQWTTGRLEILDDAGHGGGESFLAAIMRPLNEFAVM